MNLGQMIEEFRIEADDNAEPNLFSENEIRMWINQGYKEAARRSHKIVDSNTTAICEIAVTAGVAEYVLDKKIIFVKRMTIPSVQNQPLYQVKAELMDAYRPDWQSSTSPTPCLFVVGLTARHFTLYPAPATSFTLKLAVVRLPLADLEGSGDEPEDLFEEQYHSGLVQWALHRAFMKSDAEVNAPEKSSRALAAFEAEFGTRELANAQMEHLQMNQQTYVFNSGLI